MLGRVRLLIGAVLVLAACLPEAHALKYPEGDLPLLGAGQSTITPHTQYAYVQTNVTLHVDSLTHPVVSGSVLYGCLPYNWQDVSSTSSNANCVSLTEGLVVDHGKLTTTLDTNRCFTTTVVSSTATEGESLSVQCGPIFSAPGTNTNADTLASLTLFGTDKVAVARANFTLPLMASPQVDIDLTKTSFSTMEANTPVSFTVFVPEAAIPMTSSPITTTIQFSDTNGNSRDLPIAMNPNATCTVAGSAGPVKTQSRQTVPLVNKIVFENALANTQVGRGPYTLTCPEVFQYTSDSSGPLRLRVDFGLAANPTVLGSLTPTIKLPARNPTPLGGEGSGLTFLPQPARAGEKVSWSMDVKPLQTGLESGDELVVRFPGGFTLVKQDAPSSGGDGGMMPVSTTEDDDENDVQVECQVLADGEPVGNTTGHAVHTPASHSNNEENSDVASSTSFSVPLPATVASGAALTVTCPGLRAPARVPAPSQSQVEVWRGERSTYMGGAYMPLPAIEPRLPEEEDDDDDDDAGKFRVYAAVPVVYAHTELHAKVDLTGFDVDRGHVVTITVPDYYTHNNPLIDTVCLGFVPIVTPLGDTDPLGLPVLGSSTAKKIDGGRLRLTFSPMSAIVTENPLSTQLTVVCGSIRNPRLPTASSNDATITLEDEDGYVLLHKPSVPLARIVSATFDPLRTSVRPSRTFPGAVGQLRLTIGGAPMPVVEGDTIRAKLPWAYLFNAGGEGAQTKCYLSGSHGDKAEGDIIDLEQKDNSVDFTWRASQSTESPMYPFAAVLDLTLVCSSVRVPPLGVPEKLFGSVELRSAPEEDSDGRGALIASSDVLLLFSILPASISQDILFLLRSSLATSPTTAIAELGKFGLSLEPGDIFALSLPSPFTATADAACELVDAASGAAAAGTSAVSRLPGGGALQFLFTLGQQLLPQGGNPLSKLELRCDGARVPAAPLTEEEAAEARVEVRSADGVVLAMVSASGESLRGLTVTTADMCKVTRPNSTADDHDPTEIGNDCSFVVQSPLTNTVTPAKLTVEVLAPFIAPDYAVKLTLPEGFWTGAGGTTRCEAAFEGKTLAGATATKAVPGEGAKRVITFTPSAAMTGPLVEGNGSGVFELSCTRIRTPRGAVPAATAVEAAVVHLSSGAAVSEARGLTLRSGISAGTLGHYVRKITRSESRPSSVGDVVATIDSLHVSLRKGETLVMSLPKEYELAAGGMTTCDLKHNGAAIAGSTTINKHGDQRLVMFEVFQNVPVPTDTHRSVSVLSCGNIRNPVNVEPAREDISLWTQAVTGEVISRTEAATIPAVTAPSFAGEAGLTTIATGGMLGTRLIVRASPLHWHFPKGGVMRIALPASHPLKEAPICTATVHGLVIQPVRAAAQGQVLLVRFESAFMPAPLVSGIMEVVCRGVTGDPGVLSGITVQGVDPSGIVAAHTVSAGGNGAITGPITLMPSIADGPLLLAAATGDGSGGSSMQGAFDLIGALGNLLGSFMPSELPGQSIIQAIVPAELAQAGSLTCAINGVAVDIVGGVGDTLQLLIPDEALGASGAVLACDKGGIGSTPTLIDPWGIFVITPEGEVAPVAVHRSPYVRAIGGAYAEARHESSMAGAEGTLTMKIKAVNTTLSGGDYVYITLPPELRLDPTRTQCDVKHDGAILPGNVTIVPSLLRFSPFEPMRHYVERQNDIDFNDDGSPRSSAPSTDVTAGIETVFTCSHVRRARAVHPPVKNIAVRAAISDVIVAETTKAVLREGDDGMVPNDFADAVVAMRLIAPVTDTFPTDGSSNSTAESGDEDEEEEVLLLTTAIAGNKHTIEILVEGSPTPLAASDTLAIGLPSGWTFTHPSGASRSACYVSSSIGAPWSEENSTTTENDDDDDDDDDDKEVILPKTVIPIVAARDTASTITLRLPATPPRATSTLSIRCTNVVAPPAAAPAQTDATIVLTVTDGADRAVATLPASRASVPAVAPPRMGAPSHVSLGSAQEPGSVGDIVAKFAPPLAVEAGNVLEIELEAGWSAGANDDEAVECSVNSAAAPGVTTETDDVDGLFIALPMPAAIAANKAVAVTCANIRRPAAPRAGGAHAVLTLRQAAASNGDAGAVKMQSPLATIDSVYRGSWADDDGDDVPVWGGNPARAEHEHGSAASVGMLKLIVAGFPFPLPASTVVAELEMPSGWVFDAGARATSNWKSVCSAHRAPITGNGTIGSSSLPIPAATLSSATDSNDDSGEGSSSRSVRVALSLAGAGAAAQPGDGQATVISCSNVRAPLGERDAGAGKLSFSTVPPVDGTSESSTQSAGGSSVVLIKTNNVVIPAVTKADMTHMQVRIEGSEARAGVPTDLRVSVIPLAQPIAGGGSEAVEVVLPPGWSRAGSDSPTSCSLVIPGEVGRVASTTQPMSDGRIRVVPSQTVPMATNGLFITCTNIKPPPRETAAREDGELRIVTLPSGSVRAATTSGSVSAVAPGPMGEQGGVKIVHTPGNAGSVGAVVVTVKYLVNDVPEKGKVTLQLPKGWSGKASDESSSEDAQSQTTVCSATESGASPVSGTGTIDGRDLTFTVGEGSKLPSAVEVVIMCAPVAAPGTATDKVTGVTVTSVDADGVRIDVTTSAVVSAITPAGTPGGEDDDDDDDNDDDDDDNGGTPGGPDGNSTTPIAPTQRPGVLHSLVLAQHTPLTRSQARLLTTQYTQRIGGISGAVKVWRQSLQRIQKNSPAGAVFLPASESDEAVSIGDAADGDYHLIKYHGHLFESIDDDYDYIDDDEGDLSDDDSSRSGPKSVSNSGGKLTYAKNRELVVTTFIEPSETTTLLELYARVNTQRLRIAQGVFEALQVPAISASGADAVAQWGAPVGCFSKTIDGNETDVDCGGSECAQCEPLQLCEINSDCSSAVCMHSVCAEVPNTNSAPLPAAAGLGMMVTMALAAAAAAVIAARPDALRRLTGAV